MESTRAKISVLERTHREAARRRTHTYSREPGTITQLFKDLHWDTFQAGRTTKRLSIQCGT